MTSFSLHDALRFELVGVGALADYLRMQYADFEDTAGQPVDLRIRIESALPGVDRELRLSGYGEAYSRAGKNFVWQTEAGMLCLDGSVRMADLAELTVEAGFPRMLLNRLLEFRFRLAMLRFDAVLVHACCLARRDSGVLLPAWKGTGKTSLCLTLLARGYGFLSDDRVWLRRDGELLCYPRYLVINASNAREFSGLLSTRARLAHGFHRALAGPSRLPGLVSKAARRLVRSPVDYFQLHDLFPDAETPRQVPLRSAFFVIRPGSSEMAWQELSPSELASAIRGVADFEWNAELMMLVGAHDVLFPAGPSWRQELDELLQAEADVLSGALQAADCAQLQLPADVDWRAAAEAVDRRARA